MFKKSRILILVLFLATPTAYAACGHVVELFNVRASLLDKQNQLEEARDRTKARIASLQQALDLAQQQQDKLSSEIINVRHAIVDMDKAIASSH